MRGLQRKPYLKIKNLPLPLCPSAAIETYVFDVLLGKACAPNMHAHMRCFALQFAVLLVAALVLADEARAPLHFKPQGHLLGDVHPFFKDGECWLYYLKPGNYESALVRSRDWLHWTEAPITHEVVKAEDWMQPYFVLGVFRDPVANVFRSFYGHAQGRMVSSVSTNLLHWSCASQAFSVPPGEGYQRRRDPYVFWIPENQEYGCVMTTQMSGRAKEQAGAISFATSPDLQHWQNLGSLIDPGTIGEPECPQMFRLGKRWYLLASIYDRAVGKPVYWVSDQPSGPWSKEPAGPLDGKDLCATQLAFDGETPVLFGWIPFTPAKPGKQTWGGHLALPREVYALPDGSLGTRLPARLKLSQEGHSMPDFAFGSKPYALADKSHHLIAEFTLKMPPEVREVRLRFDPLGVVVLRRDKLVIVDGKGEPWSELPTMLPSNEPFKVTLVVEGDVAEVFVKDRYSLVARLPACEGPWGLSFATDGAEAGVTSMRVSQ